MKKSKLCVSMLLMASPLLAFGQAGVGPQEGDREFLIAGAGSSESDFDSSTFGLVGEMGWYLRDAMVAGVRQSINYASIEGQSITDDFWNGSTRAYLDYHFNLDSEVRPFVGTSLGLIYGDGVNNSGFAGLDVGLKYYVLPKTFIMARFDYQWFFDDSDDVNDKFDDGAWEHTIGIGYNF